MRKPWVYKRKNIKGWWVGWYEGGKRKAKAFPTKALTSKKWNRVRDRFGMPDLKFHDLRKTFASVRAQRGVSTAVTQRLLEHSSPQLTNEVYTNVDPVLRQAVELLPVADWV